MIDPGFTAAGALVGFVVGITGVGGGALMTPILLLIFGVAPTTAVATDLVFAAATKIVGARVHLASGQVDWQVARRLWLGSLPTALLIVAAVSLGAHLVTIDWLSHAIGVVLLVTSAGLLAAPWLKAHARGRRIGTPARFKALQPALTVASGALLGLLVALTSIGAGALGSVMMLYLYPLRMKPHRLVATDLVHAVPLAIAAGLGYLFAGMVDWRMLASLLAGSIPAVLLGSMLGVRLDGRWIRAALAIVLMAAGWKVLA